MSEKISCVLCDEGVIEFMIVRDHVYEVLQSENGIEKGDEIRVDDDEMQKTYFCNHCNMSYTKDEVGLAVENPEKLQRMFNLCLDEFDRIENDNERGDKNNNERET